MMERATLRDVAELAGVSLGTASNALTMKPHVREEVRERVLQAAQTLGYVHVPRQRSSSLFGVIGKVDDGQPMILNPFYSQVLAAIERECSRYRVGTMLANIEVDRLNRPLDLPPMLLNRQVDGLIIVGTFLDQTVQTIRIETPSPIVLIDAYAPSLPLDSVLIDNQRGAEEAVSHLVALGHRHIGLIGSTAQSYPSLQERRQGYLRVLKQHRLPIYLGDCAPTRDAAYVAALELLQRSPQVTALFVVNDDMARFVMSAGRDCGRSIPDDLSVVGFDDIDAAADASPPLTTMAVDKAMLGVLGVQYLYERVNNPSRSLLTTRVGTTLIVRGSTAAPASQ